jgi:hypothetical protein
MPVSVSYILYGLIALTEALICFGLMVAGIMSISKLKDPTMNNKMYFIGAGIVLFSFPLVISSLLPLSILTALMVIFIVRRITPSTVTPTKRPVAFLHNIVMGVVVFVAVILCFFVEGFGSIVGLALSLATSLLIVADGLGIELTIKFAKVNSIFWRPNTPTH